MRLGISRVVDRLIRTRLDLIEVSAMANGSLARSYGVSATPTLLRMTDGKFEKMLVGPHSEKRILDLLDGYRNEPAARRFRLSL